MKTTTTSPKKQRGVTLTELMVGSAVGLFVIAGVLSVYVAVAQSSAETLGASRLNQEMSALMSVMVSDIRRAGYWRCSSELDEPQRNPFSQIVPTGSTVAATVLTWDENTCEPEPTARTVAAATAIEVRNYQNNTRLTPADDDILPVNPTTRTVYRHKVTRGDATSPTNCITYAYDANDDGDVNHDEIFGFHLLDNGEVRIRLSVPDNNSDDIVDDESHVNDCAIGAWNAVNDNNVVRVTELNFTLTATCTNSGDSVNPDCYANTPADDSGNATTEKHRVSIELVAQLANAANPTRVSVTQDVFVRNDIVRVW